MNGVTTPTTFQTPVGYSALIRGNRNFRYLWFGQIISLLGDWFNLIASAALIGQLTHSGLAVGTLFVVRMLAPFVVSPIAGVVADCYNRKQILIVSDAIRALLVFAFLLVRDAGDIWLLYTLTALQLGFSGFYFPARTAILPDVVTPQELGSANALSSATWSVMLALGAALGGLVSGTWGIYPSFMVDASSFVLSAFLTAQVVYVAPRAADTVKTISAALKQYAEGIRYLRDHADVLVLTLHKAMNAFFLSSSFQVVQVAIAQKVFIIGEGGGISMGLMFAAAGIGTGVGPILARYITGDRETWLRWFIALGYLVGGIGLAVSAPLTSLTLLLVGATLRGIGGGTVWVYSTQLLMQVVPAPVRGRIFATEFAFFYLTSALSSTIVGSALDVMEISSVIWWMAILTVIPLGLWVGWMRRR